jgi:hypothetical protein
MKIAARHWANPHPFGTMLFDLENDPQQMHPIQNPQVERRMMGLMINLMRANDAPIEQYERLGLPVDGEITDQHLRTIAETNGR